jgi:hypothetical protein
MTQISTGQHEQLEAAFGPATKKFEVFVEGLSADEQDPVK